MSTIRVAIVGASGAVGRMLMELLQQRKFPVSELHLLASPRSAGEEIEFGEEKLVIENLSNFDFARADVAIFSAGSDVAVKYTPQALEAGCRVIDNSSAFRYLDSVPLVVPEVNRHALADNNGVVSNPNCSTAQLVLALKPIHDAYGLEAVDVATYQSVSGAGQQGVDELAQQTGKIMNGADTDNSGVFGRQIAFNLLPAIGAIQEQGYCQEEMKMVLEIQKILGIPNLQVNPTCVRVPVFYSHGEAVSLRTYDPVNIEEARELLSRAEGIEVRDEDPHSITALDSTNTDAVLVGRIRPMLNNPRGLNMWVIADNLRKGAALNAIQIAEHWFDIGG